MKKNSRKQFTSVDHSVCSKIFDALHNPRAVIARRAITPEPHSSVWTKSEQLRRKLASFELGSPRVSTNMVAKTRRDSTETADSSSVTNSPGSFRKIPRTSTAYRKYGTITPIDQCQLRQFSEQAQLKRVKNNQYELCNQINPTNRSEGVIQLKRKMKEPLLHSLANNGSLQIKDKAQRRLRSASRANRSDREDSPDFCPPKLIDSRRRNSCKHPSRIMSNYNSVSDEENDSSPMHRDSHNSLQTPMNMRACLIQELIDTQSVFTADMQQLQAAFTCVVVPITNDDRYGVLGNLDEIVEVSKELNRCWCQEMLKHASKHCDRVNVANVTLPFKSKLYSAFSEYSTNYNPKNFTKNFITESFVEKGFQILLKSNPTLLNAESMLIKPVQRVFKYQQLFERLKQETSSNHVDYQATCELHDYFCALLRKINETKRWNEILGDVFNENSRRRFSNNLKSFGQLFRNLRPSRITHTDPKLAQEKWKLENLQTMSKAFQKWIIRRMDLIEETLISERSFLYLVQNVFNASGSLTIHSQIKTISGTGSHVLQDVNSHITIADATRSHLLLTVKPKLDLNVVQRLQTLSEILNDPGLLLEELDRTEQRLTEVRLQRDQAATRNQPLITLEEELATLKRTRDTILENLLTQLPLLTKSAEKLLFSAVAYALMLSANIMHYYTTLLANRIQKSRTNSVPATDVNSQILMDYTDEVIDWIRARKSLELPKTPLSDTGSSCATRHFSGVTSRHLEILRQNIRENTRTVMDRLPEIRSTTKPGIMRAHSDVSETSRTQYPADVSPSSATPIPTTLEQTRFVCNLDIDRNALATHRAGFSYEARDCHQVSLRAGQLVVMLQDHDAAGNPEWCRVYVLPTEVTGFVPASYLKPI